MKTRTLIITTLAVLLSGCSTPNNKESDNLNFIISLTSSEQEKVSLLMAPGFPMASTLMLTMPDGKSLSFDSPTYSIVNSSAIYSGSVSESVIEKINYEFIGAGEQEAFTFVIGNKACRKGMTIELKDSQYELCGFDISIKQKQMM